MRRILRLRLRAQWRRGEEHYAFTPLRSMAPFAFYLVVGDDVERVSYDADIYAVHYTVLYSSSLHASVCPLATTHTDVPRNRYTAKLRRYRDSDEPLEWENGSYRRMTGSGCLLDNGTKGRTDDDALWPTADVVYAEYK